MTKYRTAVNFSGGAASYVAAKLILDELGHDGVALVFADTLIEDEDLYRFLGDAERRLNHPVIRISEGRDPWSVFFAERMMGNSRWCGGPVYFTWLVTWIGKNRNMAGYGNPTIL